MIKFIPVVFVLAAGIAAFTGCATLTPSDHRSTTSKERESLQHQQGIERQLRAIESRVSNIPDPR
jgi:hypothetical protein